MAYIGNKPLAKYATLTRQTFSSPTGTSHTLSQTVTNSDDLLLYINNVKQNPADYTASGTTLTTASLAGGTEMYCLYYGKTTETVAVPASSVGDSHMVDMAASKLTGALPAISGASLTNLPVATSVAFPATQVASADANTLDDYEEGTWTPGFLLGGWTPGSPMYARNGTYTKIGRQVTVDFSIYPGSTSFTDATQEMQVGPLPFTSASTGAPYGWGGTCDTWNMAGWSGGTYNTGSLTVKYIAAQIYPNSTLMKFRACDETSAQYHLRNAIIVGSGQIRATVTYFV